MDEHGLVRDRTRTLVREAAAVGVHLVEQGGLHTTDRRALGLLDALAGDRPPTPGRLADELGLSPAATTALVDRLVTAGLVQRRRDLPDRRQVRLALTDKARQFGREVLGPLGRRIDAAVARLDPAQAQVVADFLTDVLDTDTDTDTDSAPDAGAPPGA